MTPRTRLLWIETPGNPLMSITDIAACAELASEHGAWLAVDNTFPTPVLTRPLEFGAHLVMHSATKYLGGHSDVLGGVSRRFGPRTPRSAVLHSECDRSRLGPFDSFLVARGTQDAGTARSRTVPNRPSVGRIVSRRSARRARALSRAGKPSGT